MPSYASYSYRAGVAASSKEVGAEVGAEVMAPCKLQGGDQGAGGRLKPMGKDYIDHCENGAPHN